MNLIKTCPYCGEEILAVAKKCKHCSEWLDEKSGTRVECPICGEANPSNATICIHCGEAINDGYKSSSCETKHNDFPHDSPFEVSFPISIAIYILVLWMGGFAETLMTNLVILENPSALSSLTMSAFTALGGAILIVGLGIWYSHKFQSPTRTYATIRTWLAFGIAYMWWPVFMVIIRGLQFVGAFDSYYGGYREPSGDWYVISYFFFIISGIIIWCILKFGKKPSLDNMYEYFCIFSVASITLIILATIIQFGPTSIIPGIHL